MKKFQIAAVLLSCLSLASLAACSTAGTQPASEQLVEVTRGNLAISVSGSGNMAVPEDAKLYFGTAGRVENISAEDSDEVGMGDILAQLDTDPLEIALSQAQAGKAQAEAGVTQAKATLQAAEYALDEALDPFSEEDIDIAQLSLENAEYYLDYAEMKQENSWSTENMRYWENEVYRTRVTVATARQTLDDMLAGTDAEQIAILETQLLAAQQSLAMNEETLTMAEQSLALAQKQLNEATITAPFAGTIAGVYAEEGDTVPAAAPMFYLIDTGTMELEIEIDEIDITGVNLGQKALIEIDAVPDTIYEGTVSNISQAPKIESGLVSYNVTITLNNPNGSGLKLGMSATADIVSSESADTLIVPSRAIMQDNNGNYFVRVKSGEEIQERAVTTGISNGLDTEILSGLDEGETVLVETQSSSSGVGGFFGR